MYEYKVARALVWEFGRVDGVKVDGEWMVSGGWWVVWWKVSSRSGPGLIH
jgi:hypothetical protein